MKMLATKLDDPVADELSFLARLAGMTVTDALREAAEHWMAEVRQRPAVAEKLQELLDRINNEHAEQLRLVEGLKPEGG